MEASALTVPPILHMFQHSGSLGASVSQARSVAELRVVLIAALSNQLPYRTREADQSLHWMNLPEAKIVLVPQDNSTKKDGWLLSI